MQEVRKSGGSAALTLGCTSARALCKGPGGAARRPGRRSVLVEGRDLGLGEHRLAWIETGLRHGFRRTFHSKAEALEVQRQHGVEEAAALGLVPELDGLLQSHE